MTVGEVLELLQAQFHGATVICVHVVGEIVVEGSDGEFVAGAQDEHGFVGRNGFAAMAVDDGVVYNFVFGFLCGCHTPQRTYFASD